MERYALFSRIDLVFKQIKDIDYIEYTLPNNCIITGYAYKQVATSAKYDIYGYYHLQTVNSYFIIARFTPCLVGRYRWAAMYNGKCVDSGEFEVYDNKTPGGFVSVSDDPHYFMLSSGHSFVPIGIKLQPQKIADAEYYTSEELNFGIAPYLRRIKNFAENGGNLVNICLTDPLFNIRTEFSNVTRSEAFFNLWHVIECCRENNVKVKLTLESFKTLKNDASFAKKDCRTIKDIKTGRRILDINHWLNDDECFDAWFSEIEQYFYRYWNDPVIMAFELWEEMDLIDAPKEDIIKFSNKAIEKIKEISPQNMVTVGTSLMQSLADNKRQKEFLDAINISFLQTRRFLNRSAELAECTWSAQEMSALAVERMAVKDKPMLLSGTGAVDINGSPFGFYSIDYHGILLNDCAFTPFFKGAAGVGILEHVAEYIEPLNLYSAYKPFADMLHNVKVHRQHFKCTEITRKKAKIYVLKGRSTTLIYVRAKDDIWRNLLHDSKEPYLIRGIKLPSFSGKTARFYPLFKDNVSSCEIKLSDSEFTLPPFRYGYFIKIR